MQNNKSIFILLFLLNLLNYTDRQVLYAVFPLIHTDLQLTDFQLGTLASAFMLVYMCYAPIIGYLADRMARHRLIGISALLWSGATMACATSARYLSLLISRSLIGVGEGGFTTIAQPFLAEHYPKKKHAFILAAFGLALPLGSALGYALGGLVGQHWGWRVAFLAAGIPGIFLGLWFFVGVKDNRHPSGSTHNGPSLADYLPLLKNKPFLSVCFAQAMSTFLMGGLAAWMPMYLHRYLGLDTAHAGLYFGGMVIGCGALGTLAGGKLAQWFHTRIAHAYCQLIGFSFLAALPFCWLTLLPAPAIITWICLGTALFILFIPTGAIAAALVETTSPAIRSMAFACNIFIIHLLGDAISPSLVGWMSDQWNLRVAVAVASLVLIPGVLACHFWTKNSSTP